MRATRRTESASYSEVRWPAKGYKPYNTCFDKLVRLGFRTIPGSSKFIKGEVGTGKRAYMKGRIVEGPGSGDTFFIEITQYHGAQ
jgi:hypothetical protein